jgi:Fic-DOC domain mobile mystery protein B
LETSHPDGATPIDADEAEGLIPTHITSRKELDELEEANIQAALMWSRRKALSGKRRSDVLNEHFLFDLHRRMFSSVWKWAGEIRRTNKNIGVDKFLIRTEVRKLIEDARYWRENGIYDRDEIAVRFHHRLVAIHPFPNGNGRHSRLMADLLVQQTGGESFSWGSSTLTAVSELRAEYIAALRKADEGDLTALLAFARS